MAEPVVIVASEHNDSDEKSAFAAGVAAATAVQAAETAEEAHATAESAIEIADGAVAAVSRVAADVSSQADLAERLDRLEDIMDDVVEAMAGGGESAEPEPQDLNAPPKKSSGTAEPEAEPEEKTEEKTEKRTRRELGAPRWFSR